MKMVKFIFMLTLMSMVYVSSDGRTVDGRRGEAEIMRGMPPLIAGPMNLPMVRQSEGGLAPGLNDIQGGLMDKADHDMMDVGPGVLVTTDHTPTVPEIEDIEPLEDKVEEEVEEEEEEGGVEVKVKKEEAAEETRVTAAVQADSPGEEFDPDIFQKENDMVVVMRRMYEALTKRMGLLKSRVSTVEQTTADILARLTDLDCSDLLTRGQKESGVYTLHMDHNGKRPVEVACDMDTDGGGWTVIQRRTSHSKEIDFNRGWFDYKMGFGNVSSDFWIGLENIYIWTNTRHYELRIDLTDFDGDASFAQYDHFYIESEDNGYRLHISGYSGTSGDSMGNEGKADNFTADGMMFTTHDEDHDTSHEINCAKYWKIGGWWFNRCSWANLNGPYREPGEGDGIGINWHMWRNKEYLRSSTMMIRPTRNF